MHVTVTTLEFSAGNSNKFYRIYQAETDDTNLYFQWGSQNNGRKGGQFKVAPHKDLNARDRELVKKLNEKRTEGYLKVKDETGAFEVPNYEASWTGTSDPNVFVKWLASEYDRLWKGRTSTPPKYAPDKAPKGSPAAYPYPSTAGKGTLELLNDRFIGTLITVSSDPIAGLAQLSLLRLDLEAVKTEVRKLEDYRDTLEMMTEDAL